MLVELIQAPKATAKAFSRQRGTAPIESVARERRRDRHLADLERDNEADLHIDLPRDLLLQTALASTIHTPPNAKKRKQSPNVRRILNSKKTLSNHLDALHQIPWERALVKASPYPARSFCAVCGNRGRYRCDVCAFKVCSRPCKIVHLESH